MKQKSRTQFNRMTSSQTLTINNTTFQGDELRQWCFSGLETANEDDRDTDVYRFILDWLDEKAYISVRTSGSTGTPKLINLQKSWMVSSALNTISALNLNSGLNSLLCLPARYIAGKMMIVRAFVGGFHLIIKKPAPQPFSDIGQSIHFAAVTPFQFYQSLDDIKNQENLTLLIGGGELGYGLKQKIRQLKCRVIQTYGMTETCSHVALKMLNGHKKDNHYTVLPGISIDQDNRGCLTLHVSYMNNKKIITNDLVDIFSPQKFTWLGRNDNVINSGGIKIIPELVEVELAPVLKHRPFFIGSIPDSSLGEKALLVIECSSDCQKIVSALRALYTQQKPGYQWPRILTFLPLLIKNENGKIQRQETMEYIKNNQIEYLNM